MLGAVVATQSTIETMAEKAAVKYGIEPAAVKAVISIESNWNPSAYRYEAHLKDASWGLMQVLLRTAREVSGNPSLTATDLLKPEINIDIGTKYLTKQYVRYQYNIYDAVAAYNAGSVRKTITGRYENQAHVNRFKIAYLKYKSLGGLKSVMPIIAAGTIGAVMLMTHTKKK
jgi:soluble lytic murein transglycosylase-like protein